MTAVRGTAHGRHFSAPALSVLSTTTCAPGFRSRSALNGPTTTSSPSLRPVVTSTSISPLIPVVTGRNSAFLAATTYTPSMSLGRDPPASDLAGVPTGVAALAGFEEPFPAP